MYEGDAFLLQRITDAGKASAKLLRMIHHGVIGSTSWFRDGEGLVKLLPSQDYSPSATAWFQRMTGAKMVNLMLYP